MSNEIKGEGNSYTAEFWEYDPRSGRRWNLDPVPKVYESPYATFGGNPLVNIDPTGADTINITRTTTRRIGPTLGNKLDNFPSRKMPDIITMTAGINITEAEGNDVFRITNVNITINEDGSETNVSNTTTLELNNPQTFYRTGGRNMKGYSDDRYALASNAPSDLLKYYADKSGDIGVKSTLALQRDIKLAGALQEVSNVIYTVSGVYGVARIALARTMISAVAKNSFKSAFAHGLKYHPRIRARAPEDPVAHNFPYSFDDFILTSKPIIQKDGSYLYRYPGALNGKDGFYELGVNPETRLIFHRTFTGN